MRTFLAQSTIPLLAFFPAAHSFAIRPICILGLAQCVSIQSKDVPLRDAEAMAEDCRDFTRRNVGAIALRLSQKEILERSRQNLNHPLLRASIAYSALHDSPLQFDRSLPIEQRYFPVKRTCGLVFHAVRQAPPSDED